MTIEEPDVDKLIKKAAKRLHDNEEKKWKKVERWLLFGNLLVSTLQLIASLYQIFKR